MQPRAAVARHRPRAPRAERRRQRLRPPAQGPPLPRHSPAGPVRDRIPPDLPRPGDHREHSAGRTCICGSSATDRGRRRPRAHTAPGVRPTASGCRPVEPEGGQRGEFVGGELRAAALLVHDLHSELDLRKRMRGCSSSARSSTPPTPTPRRPLRARPFWRRSRALPSRLRRRSLCPQSGARGCGPDDRAENPDPLRRQRRASGCRAQSGGHYQAVVDVAPSGCAAGGSGQPRRVAPT